MARKPAEVDSLDVAADALPNVSQALTDGVTDKRLAILRGVASTGSISEAARQVGVSYKSAWQAIETLSNLAGTALVEKVVGGAGGVVHGSPPPVPVCYKSVHSGRACSKRGLNKSVNSLWDCCARG